MHPRDASIVFDEGPHTYTVHGKVMSRSVTGLIARVESEHFDAPAVAKRLASSRTPSEKYSRVGPDGVTRVAMCVPEILGLWDLARDLGTALHSKIERYLNGIPITFDSADEVNVVEFRQFVAWWQKQLAAGFEAYRSEWVIYAEEWDLAGSIDFVMRNKATGELTIVDWKRCLTNGSGFSSAWKGRKMLPPMHHLEETKLNHWKVQVNVYRAILEKHYGVVIAEMKMVVLYDTQTEAVEYCHDRDDSVHALILSAITQE